MIKWKKLLIWLLTAVLLILGGSLPFLMSVLRDRLDRDQIQYRDMDSLELIFASEEKLSPEAKLALMQNDIGDTQEVEYAQDAVEQLDDILPEIYAQVDQYVAMGILPVDIYNAELTLANAFLIYMPDLPEINAVMWNLEFSTEGGGVLYLVIDGSAGQILAMEYGYPMGEIREEMNAAVREELEEKLYVLMDQYFSILGLDAARTVVDKQYLKNGVSQTVMVETQYGEVYMVFEWMDSRFSIYPAY